MLCKLCGVSVHTKAPHTRSIILRNCIEGVSVRHTRLNTIALLYFCKNASFLLWPLGGMDPSIAIALVIASKRRKRRRRRLWAKQWFLERGRKFGNQSLLVELRQNEPEDFKNFLRMNGNSFDELLAMVTPLIEKQKTIMRDPISPIERLSVTLRYLATGNSFEDLKFSSAVSPQAIGKIVIETCEALITCLGPYIKMPKTEDEWKVVADEFRRKWNFPHAIGAIDGKHVSIKKPPGSGSFYYNYKGFFSIVLMAVVNANYEFIMVDAGINGRVSDGGVISYSTFGRMMEQNKLCIPASEKLHENDKACLPFVFLADDAFTLGENLMKPYGGEGAGKLDLSQCIYNYRVSRARRVVENAFGILVSRFGVFERAIKLAPEKAKSITLACCYLHNYLRKRSGSYVASGTVDWEDDNGVVHQGSWRESQRNLEGLRATYGRNASAQAKYYRDLYKEYFNSKGAVPWQKEHCTWLN